MTLQKNITSRLSFSSIICIKVMSTSIGYAFAIYACNEGNVDFYKLSTLILMHEGNVGIHSSTIQPYA